MFPLRGNRYFKAISWALVLGNALVSQGAGAQSSPTPSLAAESPRVNSPPGTPPSTPSGPLVASDGTALGALASALVALDAIRLGHGSGNYAAPLYVPSAPKGTTKGPSHLCRVGPELPATCSAPAVAPHSTQPPVCTHCDSVERDRAWQRYVRAELGVSALGSMLRLRDEQNAAQLPVRPLAEQLTEWLKSLDASLPGSRALQAGLKELQSAANSRSRGAALNRHLQSLLESLELSMTPDDLSEEGGLRATLKLAGHVRDHSRAAWQQQFQTWAQCQLAAINSGKQALAESVEVERCNRRSEGSAPATEPSVLNGLRSSHEYQACLHSTPTLQLTLAQYQSTPCSDNALLATDR
jgi:hypothetical protein